MIFLAYGSAASDWLLPLCALILIFMCCSKTFQR